MHFHPIPDLQQAADVVSNGNVAAEAGSYEAMVSVVKQNLEMQIPHQGGSLRCWKGCLETIRTFQPLSGRIETFETKGDGDLTFL